MSYSNFIKEVQTPNRVESIVLDGTKATVEIISNAGKEKYIVYVPDVQTFMSDVSPAIKSNQIKAFTVKPPTVAPWWVAILPTVGLIVIFILFWVFFLQQSQAAAETG
jgi:cell division protease FtsH